MDYKLRIEEKGLKQKYIAKQLGVRHDLLCKWLNGKVNIPKKRIPQLETLLS